MPSGTMKQLEEIKQIFSMQDNWKTLRRMHREAHAPAILHTGLFLQDIVAIDEGVDDQLNGRVNIKKLLRLHEKIATISMYQQSGYQFKDDPLIQQVIQEDFKAQEKLTADHLFDFSTVAKDKDSVKRKPFFSQN